MGEGTTCTVNLMDRAPSHVLPQTNWLVLLCTDMNKFGEGVKRLGSTGSSVMVGRLVGVNVVVGVKVNSGVFVSGVVVGSCVLIAKRSGVLEAGKPNGVAVG